MAKKGWRVKRREIKKVKRSIKELGWDRDFINRRIRQEQRISDTKSRFYKNLLDLKGEVNQKITNERAKLKRLQGKG